MLRKRAFIYIVAFFLLRAVVRCDEKTKNPKKQQIKNKKTGVSRRANVWAATPAGWTTVVYWYTFICHLWTQLLKHPPQKNDLVI